MLPPKHRQSARLEPASLPTRVASLRHSARTHPRPATTSVGGPGVSRAERAGGPVSERKRTFQRQLSSLSRLQIASTFHARVRGDPRAEHETPGHTTPTGATQNRQTRD